MKKVKCPICNRYRIVESNIILVICPACQVGMEETIRFCGYCGEELKEGEVEFCGGCNLLENDIRTLYYE